MSVRHVHAKPGEYIAVHRNHGGGGGGSSSSDGGGCLAVIAVIFVVWFIASFWQIIVACAVTAIILWMIWIFRKPLGKAICWSAKKIWHLIAISSTQISKGICSCWLKFNNWRNQKRCQNPAIPHSISPEYNNSSADYGKIIQNRR